MSLFNDSIKTSFVNEDGLWLLEMNYELSFVNEVINLEMTWEDDLFFLIIHNVTAEDYDKIKED